MCTLYNARVCAVLNVVPESHNISVFEQCNHPAALINICISEEVYVFLSI